MHRRKHAVAQSTKQTPHHTKKSRRVKITQASPPLMSHIGYQGARHLHPDRLPTKIPEKTVSVRLLDLRQETIENVQNIADTIKRLIIPGLRLKTVPESLVDRLLILEKLDISNNNLSDGSLPDAMKKLERLVELNLNGNSFTKVPATLKKLKTISRLDMSENELENLNGLDKLRRMQILVVDNNKLTTVFKDICHMKRLEILRCSHNRIKDIGVEVRLLKNLRDLDLSSNKLVFLPADVLLLPSMEVLNVSQNKITKVPSFNIKIHDRHWVSDIDLSDNEITVFPGHLLRMTEKLDLSSNQIRTLSMHAMKELERNPDHELIVDENPLTFPPAEITGQKAMLAYIHEARLNTPVYRGMKILVLGSHKSGKTSLIQSLIDQQGRLSEELNESASGIDVYETTFDCEVEHVVKNEETGKKIKQKEVRPLNLCVWDFCGHPFYLYPHYLFFEQQSVALLTFNMKEYSAENFEDMIGSWLDWMIAKTNSLKVVLVGTNCDKLSKEKVNEIKAGVKSKMTEFRNRHEQLINERMSVITAKTEISPTLKEQLMSYRNLLRFTDTFTIQTDVIVTSSAEYKGFNQLRNSIETIAREKEQSENSLPSILEKVKTFWVDVEDYIEEKANTMVVPIIPWDEYVEEVTGKFGMKRQIRDITQYLHVTGKVIWFSIVPSLSNYVFIRPSWLFDILRNIYRHDLEEKLDFSIDDTYKTMGITQTRFDRNKREILGQGVVDKDFLRAMMGSLIPLDAQEKFHSVVELLLNGICLGYPVTKKSREMVYNLNVDIQSTDAITKILIPWMRKTTEPEDLMEHWNGLLDREKIAALLKFPKYMPPGLFEILCVYAHKEKHNLSLLAHWGGGILAKHKKHAVQVMISYNRGPDGIGATLKYELRDDSEDHLYFPVRPATMWTILLPLMQEFEEIIKTFKGVIIERFMLCKFCREPSFLGEWGTPKETQNLTERVCDVCGEIVDTDTLVQQREEKRDDVMLRLGEIRARRKDAITRGRTLDQLLEGEEQESEQPSLMANRGRRGRALLPIPNMGLILPHFGSNVFGDGTNDDDKDDNESEENEKLDEPRSEELNMACNGDV